MGQAKTTFKPEPIFAIFGTSNTTEKFWVSMEVYRQDKVNLEAGLIIPVPDSCYLGRFFTKRADFLHVHHSDIPITEYNHLEPLGKRKHVKTAVFHLFGAFFGLPDADIHSPHLPMVIYHVFGVTTFFGTIRQFHSEWPRALELPPKTLAEPQRG